MGTCRVCGRESEIVLSYTKAEYCVRDFRRLLERRIRKDIRIHGLLRSDGAYAVPDAPCARILLDVLRSIFGSGFNVVIGSPSEGRELLSPACLDEVVRVRFASFLSGDPLPNPPAPLRSTSFEELQKAFPGRVANPLPAHPLLDGIERALPGSLFGFMKGLERIREKEKKN